MSNELLGTLIERTAPAAIRAGVARVDRAVGAIKLDWTKQLALSAAKKVGEDIVETAIVNRFPKNNRARPAHVPPANLYTSGEEECKAMYPAAVDATLELTAHLAARSHERIAEHYARVLSQSSFEAEMCNAVDTRPILEHLLASLPTVVAESKQATVAIAGMVAHSRVGYDADLHARLMHEVRAAAEPPSGISSLFSSGPSADDLRSFEVVYKLLGEPKPTLVGRARAAAWQSVIANRRLDLTRHGALYGVVPLRYLRDFTVQFRPDPATLELAHLGEWGVLESVRKLAQLAVRRFSASEPEFADEMAALARSGSALGSELARLYVTRQHTGYEPAGTGYALAAAIGTLRAVAKDKVHAHAARCLLEYIRALLFVAETSAPSDAVEKATVEPTQAEERERVRASREQAAVKADIDAFVARMPLTMPARPATKPAPFAMPRVPLACRSAPTGKDARSRSVIRTACARNAELVRKSSALERLRAKPTMAIDDLFALFPDLDVLATEEELAGRVVGSIVRQTQNATSVHQKRRLAVLQRRLAEVTGRPINVLPTAQRVYEHIKENADRNEPHGLEAHELGVAHWVIPGVPIRVPFLTDAPSLGARILRELVPSVADVRDAATDLAVAVQYKADERPGVGFALYTLLPLLDHASAMRKEGRGEYDAVHGATLRAILRLLTPPPA
jgi:hypothetical protein